MGKGRENGKNMGKEESKKNCRKGVKYIFRVIGDNIHLINALWVNSAMSEAWRRERQKEIDYAGFYEFEETRAVNILNLPVGNGLFPCPVLMLQSYFRVIPSSSNSSTIYCYFVIVCVLDVVCRAFYKRSMVQSEVRKSCAHPTWFIYNEAIVHLRSIGF